MRLSRLLIFSSLLSVCVFDARLDAQQGYYREPAIHQDKIVFVSEGDLWRVDAPGGFATRLTTNHSQERQPAISPDGKTIAFVGRYEGGPEIYTMPLDGGRPQRRTFGASGVQVCGFTAQGELLYVSRHLSALRDPQLFRLDLESGQSQRLPLSEASHGAFSPDGKTVFFTRFQHRQHVKRYKGGRAEQLWRFRPGTDEEAVPLTRDWAGTSHRAMVTEDRVYFLSDRDGTRNLWSMDHAGEDLRQHTKHVGFDVMEASMASGLVVYRIGASLRLHELENGTDIEIQIRLRSDFEQSRERWIEAPMERTSAVDLSHDGSRVVLTSRGQAFVAPVKAEDGPVVTLSRKPDVRYKSATFLGPKADRVVLLSDESTEVEAWSIASDGSMDRKQLTRDATILLYRPTPSPDGRWLAWTDKRDALWLQEVSSGEKRRLERGADWVGDLAWSKDSRWLTFTRSDASGLSHVRVYDPREEKTLVASSPRFSSYRAKFSPDGRWLYFLSNRDFQSKVRSPWGDYQPEPYFEKTTAVFAIALDHSAIWPFERHADRPEKDRAEKRPTDEKLAKKGETEEEGRGERAAKKADSDKPTHALPAVRGALYRVPLPADRYSWIAVTRKGLLYAVRGQDRSTNVFRLELAAKKAKPVELAKGVTPVSLSGDAKKLLLRKSRSLYVVSAASKSPLGKSLDKSRVDLAAWKLRYDPKEDWRQIFVDSWRMHRDYFYDPGMHGVDWPAMRDKYLPLVARVHDRDELNDLIGQLIGELAALHSRASGGDQRSGSVDIANASLGADFVVDAKAGGWRIVHIHRGDPERPNLRSPLARPDLRLRPGDLIVRVDHEAFRPGLPIEALLREKSGHVVRLDVRRAGGGDLQCRVQAISPRAASELRYQDWVQGRRTAVEILSKSAIGYVHIRAMGSRDIGDWVREYAPLVEKQGLIVDVRHNGGGNIDSWILGRLSRKAWFYWKTRHRRPYWNMQKAFRGHMIVLCDHATGSDGEAFAEGFRRLGLGKVLGTRTWGGEIWLSRRNRAVDGGVASAGENGVYGPEGQWLIEGHGVVPDIEVDNLPHATFGGKDAQLEAAIEYLQKQIAADPRAVPAAPPFPDKSSEDNRRRAPPAGVRRQR